MGTGSESGWRCTENGENDSYVICILPELKKKKSTPKANAWKDILCHRSLRVVLDHKCFLTSEQLSAHIFPYTKIFLRQPLNFAVKTSVCCRELAHRLFLEASPAPPALPAEQGLTWAYTWCVSSTIKVHWEKEIISKRHLDWAVVAMPLIPALRRHRSNKSFKSWKLGEREYIGFHGKKPDL